MSEGLASRSQMIKQALIGIGCLAGGIIILVVGGLKFIAGIIIGGIIALIGLSILIPKKDRLIGLITTAAGIIIMVSKIPVLGGIANVLIIISGWILIFAGGFAIIKFIINLMKQS